MTSQSKNILRPLDAEAVRHAKTLLRTARHGTIATLDPASGRPIATRVGMSTDFDGTPIILVSALSAHTPALRADTRCSLLVGELGKGDSLAHPRMTLSCDAREIARETSEESRIARRYLAHQPKAELYAGLPDFAYFRLEVQGASLNAGFGKAFVLTPTDLLTPGPDLSEIEPDAIAHMNTDHAEAVALYARAFAKAPDGRWTLTGIDAEGIDLADGDDSRRVFFETPLTSVGELRSSLTGLADRARMALAS